MSNVIWIINHYASHLEERHLNLATNFAQDGNKVVVIMSSFHHGKRTYLYEDEYKALEKEPGVYYVYLKSKPEYQTNGGKRIVNMVDFCYRFVKNMGRIEELYGKPNYVIGSSAPPFMWELGYKAAKKYKAKFIAEFRDIWPLSLVEVQGVSPSHPLVKFFGAMEKRAYKRADAIVGTMPYAYKHVCDDLGFSREKVYWMPNGLNIEKADKALVEDTIELPNELDQFLTHNWCCIYVGSIAKCESIDRIIQSWKTVNESDICLAIIGDGNESPVIDSMIAELDSARIRHFPSITKEQIPVALNKAKCCLAAIPNSPIYRFGLSMNKLNDYLYSGKPIVFACDAENVINEVDGFVVPFDDMKAMAEAIENVKQLTDAQLVAIEQREKQIVREHYDYRVIAEQYLEMMTHLS